ncbi:hypothetical protein HYQ46_011867 [Verticillium longisporum]|nr:hypothetical protein HYQ46_011867 [Verticillium longisporum]
MACQVAFGGKGASMALARKWGGQKGRCVSRASSGQEQLSDVGEGPVVVREHRPDRRAFAETLGGNLYPVMEWEKPISRPDAEIESAGCLAPSRYKNRRRSAVGVLCSPPAALAYPWLVAWSQEVVLGHLAPWDFLPRPSLSAATVQAMTSL